MNRPFDLYHLKGNLTSVLSYSEHKEKMTTQKLEELRILNAVDPSREGYDPIDHLRQQRVDKILKDKLINKGMMNKKRRNWN